MAQVIYEEEDPTMVSLRETITNLGNTFAGAIVRRQNYAQQYASAAANRAHEAYIAQIGINSREKIVGAQLAATKERNETLNKQYAETSRLAQARENREAEKWSTQKTNQLNDVDATAASQELLQSQNEFLIDKHDNIVLNKLSPEARKELETTLSKSPTINAAFYPLIKKYRKRRATIMGRLNFLKSLQKTSGDNAISQILKTDQPITISQLKGLPGSEGGGYEKLQALASKVTDDQTWNDILDSYNLDKDAITNMPQYLNDEIAEYGQMVSNYNVEDTIHRTFKNNALVKGRIKSYGENLKYFQKDATQDKPFADALLANVQGENLTTAQKDRIKNTSAVLNAGVVDFMHKTRGIFTNAQNLGNAIMKDVSRLMQNPESAETELDKKLLLLAEGGIEQDRQRLVVQDILKEFITKNDYIGHNQYKSAFGVEKGAFKKVLANWTAEPTTPASPVEAVDLAAATEKVLTHQPKEGINSSLVENVTSRDMASATQNEYMETALYGTGKGKLDVVDQGVVKGTNVSIDDPQVATKYLFSNDPEITKTETSKILKGVVNFKKDLAAKTQEKIHQVKNMKTGAKVMASMEEIFEGGGSTELGGPDVYNRMFTNNQMNVQKVTDARAERERVREMYRYNRDVALQVLLNSQDEVPLFVEDENNPGQFKPGAWWAALRLKSGSTGAVFNIDENYIVDEIANQPQEAMQTTAKQLRAMLKAMNMGFDSNVAGDEFSVSHQLRLLGDAIIQSGGNANYRHAKVGVQTESTQIAGGP